MGAALRVPDPGAHPGRLPRLLRAGRGRRSSASSPTATAGCRCPPRSSARARWRARPTARRSSPRCSDAPVRPQRLRKPTLVAISRAIEEEAIARAAGPVVIAAFQAERNYRAVEHRYRRLAHVADAVGVFAAFDERADRLRRRARRDPDRPVRRARARVGGDRRRAGLRRVPGRLGDARARAASSRRSGRWTPTVVRRAAQVGAALAARTAPAWSERLLGLLADRPLAVEQPAPGLTALTNRMISYLDDGRIRQAPA